MSRELRTRISKHLPVTRTSGRMCRKTLVIDDYDRRDPTLTGAIIVSFGHASGPVRYARVISPCTGNKRGGSTNNGTDMWNVLWLASQCEEQISLHDSEKDITWSRVESVPPHEEQDVSLEQPVHPLEADQEPCAPPQPAAAPTVPTVHAIPLIILRVPHLWTSVTVHPPSVAQIREHQARSNAAEALKQSEQAKQAILKEREAARQAQAQQEAARQVQAQQEAARLKRLEEAKRKALFSPIQTIDQAYRRLSLTRYSCGKTCTKTVFRAKYKEFCLKAHPDKQGGHYNRDTLGPFLAAFQFILQHETFSQ